MVPDEALESWLGLHFIKLAKMLFETTSSRVCVEKRDPGFGAEGLHRFFISKECLSVGIQTVDCVVRNDTNRAIGLLKQLDDVISLLSG